jgi:hypothetical protein
MENHTYNLTTEQPRYTDDTAPKSRGPACLTRREVWYPAGEWKDYKKPWVKMPAESLEALYLDHFQNDSDAAAYDFIVAQHAYPNVYPIYRSYYFNEYSLPYRHPDLPGLREGKPYGDFTKKDSGAAYAWEDWGDWDDEKRMIVPPVEAELPPWYLRVPMAKYKMKPIIEPQFSHSVLRALLDEHAALETIEAGYDCAVVAEALGVDGEDLPKALWHERAWWHGKALTTSSGNLIERKPQQGGICAIPYNEKECGMSEECLIALEQHFLDLAQDDCDYWREVCKWEVETKPPADDHVHYWPGFPRVVSNAFGPSKQERYDPQEQQFERAVNHDLAAARDFHEEFETRISDVDLLSLPINAQAATYYDNNPKAIVAKFERVDISTIPAGNMTCMCCFDDFEEAVDDESENDDSDDDSDDDDSEDDEADDAEAEDDEAESHAIENAEAKPYKIKLSIGKVRFDNSPIKMPCPHGHLIGKTCLMQLIDAEILTCPMCRFKIHSRKSDLIRKDHPGTPRGVRADQVVVQYSIWD